MPLCLCNISLKKYPHKGLEYNLYYIIYCNLLINTSQYDYSWLYSQWNTFWRWVFEWKCIWVRNKWERVRGGSVVFIFQNSDFFFSQWNLIFRIWWEIWDLIWHSQESRHFKSGHFFFLMSIPLLNILLKLFWWEEKSGDYIKNKLFLFLLLRFVCFYLSRSESFVKNWLRTAFQSRYK